MHRKHLSSLSSLKCVFRKLTSQLHEKCPPSEHLSAPPTHTSNGEALYFGPLIWTILCHLLKMAHSYLNLVFTSPNRAGRRFASNSPGNCLLPLPQTGNAQTTFYEGDSFITDCAMCILLNYLSSDLTLVKVVQLQISRTKLNFIF